MFLSIHAVAKRCCSRGVGLLRGSTVKRAIACVAVALLLAGCGGGSVDGRYGLAGKVTLKGQPLAKGTIEFSTGEGGGPLSGGTIENGQYTIPAESGLKPGTYTVRISSIEEAGGSAPAAPGPESLTQVGKEVIPAEFNVNSSKTIEVKTSGNTFDFAIP
ncbi:MAG: hypothetical protein RLY70_2543 [Planctomycetota bacterium]|jgi:hypothetical protein